MAAVLAALPASAQPPAPAPAPSAAPNAAAMFGPRRGVSYLDIAPSGRYAVYVAPARGTASVAVVVDLVSGGEGRPILRASGAPDRLRWCRFVSDAKLICSIGGIGNLAGDLIPYSRLFAVNADGTNPRELGQQQSFDDSRLRQFDGTILDWLPQDGNAVLMEREYVPEGRQTGTRTQRRADGLGVDRIDIETLRATPVEPPTGQASGYMTDGRGNVRMMISRRTQGEGQSTGRIDYLYRLAGSRAWREFSSYDTGTREGMDPIAIDGARNVAYVLKKLNGRLALYRVALDESLASELVYANDRVDVDYVIRLGRGGPVIGVTYADDQQRSAYFEPEYEELARTLARAIPGNPSIGFRDVTRDGNKVLIFAASDSNPGRYYLYDRTRRGLEEIMSVRPQLDGVTLSRVRAVTYPAADGVQVPAYLTLPPGREDARGLPGIVLPHGGPSARDVGGFDELAQFLAHQGYAVLQPNYRGSEGYGDAWLAQNGFRGWQTSIGDVTAGGRWLIAQGADANRLGIVGWSYGGYAALQSGVTEPGLFKAIVAIAPVTDLALLWEQAEGFTNYRLVRQFVGQGPHVRAGSPLQNVERITAPVLMFHGTRDINVGVLHSQRMDSALRGAGKASELVLFEGLEHDLQDSQALIRMFGRIGTFLQTELAPRQ
ncbi:MAG TPA: alpha/beta fold hydrolase [Allosphingosinicella sp.]|nr:alpha/beta fold hydrolase [Allosphingosinicella sp.]